VRRETRDQQTGENRQRAAWKRRRTERKPANQGETGKRGDVELENRTETAGVGEKCGNSGENAVENHETGPTQIPKSNLALSCPPRNPQSTSLDNASPVATKRVREVRKHHDGIVTAAVVVILVVAPAAVVVVAAAAPPPLLLLLLLVLLPSSSLVLLLSSLLLRRHCWCCHLRCCSKSWSPLSNQVRLSSNASGRCQTSVSVVEPFETGCRGVTASSQCRSVV